MKDETCGNRGGGVGVGGGEIYGKISNQIIIGQNLLDFSHKLKDWL